jgi:hypothetical protein
VVLLLIISEPGNINYGTQFADVKYLSPILHLALLKKLGAISGGDRQHDL